MHARGELSVVLTVAAAAAAAPSSSSSSWTRLGRGGRGGHHVSLARVAREDSGVPPRRRVQTRETTRGVGAGGELVRVFEWRRMSERAIWSRRGRGRMEPTLVVTRGEHVPVDATFWCTAAVACFRDGPPLLRSPLASSWLSAANMDMPNDSREGTRAPGSLR